MGVHIIMKYLKDGKWKYDAMDGIYTADDDVVATSFSDQTQNELLSLEDGSWWFIYRAEIITELMDRFFVKDRITIDIGGGNGYTSSIAKNKGYYTSLIEPNLVACQHAKLRGIDEVCCGAVTEDSVIDGSIEQATLLDVLEHIEDDVNFIGLLHRKITRGGVLLVTVPAFNCLWSSEDEAAGHFRRYHISDLSDLLEKCGFDVLYQNYFMGFLFLPILIIRVLLEKIGIVKPQGQRTEEERLEITRSQFESRSGIVNVVLALVENIEKRFLRRRRVPLGSSIIIVARNR